MNCSPAISLCRGWQPPVRRNPPRPPALWWRAPAAAKVGTICLQAMRRRGKALTSDGGPLWNNMGKLTMVSEGERVPNAPLEGVDGQTLDRKSVVTGKSVSGREDLGGSRTIKTKKLNY